MFRLTCLYFVVYSDCTPFRLPVLGFCRKLYPSQYVWSNEITSTFYISPYTLTQWYLFLVAPLTHIYFFSDPFNFPKQLARLLVIFLRLLKGCRLPKASMHTNTCRPKNVFPIDLWLWCPLRALDH